VIKEIPDIEKEMQELQARRIKDCPICHGKFDVYIKGDGQREIKVKFCYECGRKL
jgi:coenzyme F420-reducing hydrogenase beta subunit